jgi:hypothetical protein
MNFRQACAGKTGPTLNFSKTFLPFALGVGGCKSSLAAVRLNVGSAERRQF